MWSNFWKTNSICPVGKTKTQSQKTSKNGSNMDLCFLVESPFRILREAETGNITAFSRIYLENVNLLKITNKYGRTASHIAAFFNNVSILEFIFDHGGDFNLQDLFGNTPLHRAIENDSLDAIEFMLRNGINTSIKNVKIQAPLHMATELNKIKSLQLMAKYSFRFDVELNGYHGRKAIHLAAIYDYDQCAKILLQNFGASLRNPCSNGFYPIHEAARNASSKTMEIFLQWTEFRGDSRQELLSLFDSEGNVPLHSAVHSGDLKAVELCLKSGAKISTPQFDLSTPVHLACIQGSLDIIQLMFNLQPCEIKKCLNCFDAQKMSPLHYAAMLNYVSVVEYLINRGADINAPDNKKRSPLLLAAHRLSWNTADFLIKAHANIFLKDMDCRTIVHYIIINNGQIERFYNLLFQVYTKNDIISLINEKDAFNCTAVHYACREGQLENLDCLLKLGVKINVKNNRNESPVHFAAKYGRLNILIKLLSLDKGAFMINESDCDGLTPLHVACQQGHDKIVQLLLDRGALLHRDILGRNPLHLSAINGHVITTNMLLSVLSHILDHIDKDGNTALHLATIYDKAEIVTLLLSKNCRLLYNFMQISAIDYAIYYKNQASTLAMITHETRSKEIMYFKVNKFASVSEGLISNMPQMFEIILNNGITLLTNDDENSRLYSVKYDFSCFQNSNYSEYTVISNTVYKTQPLSILNAMVKNGCVNLLTHPLTEKYLETKWNTLGKYYQTANFIFYSIFVLILTIFLSILMESSKQNVLTSTNYKFFLKYFAVIIFIYILLSIMKEIYKLYQGKWIYFKDFLSLINWALYISLIIAMIPIVMPQVHICMHSFASLATFLSWFNLLLHLQRFDNIGIYVVMFLEILQTLIKVLFIFSILIIAFGLSFYILLNEGNHVTFSSIAMSLMRTFSMMAGDFDIMDTFFLPYLITDKWNRSIPYPIITFLILILFIIFMPILLINLMIGLAVGNIESIQRNAKLKRLAMQVVLHTNLERFLPKFLLNKIHRTYLIECPSADNANFTFFSVRNNSNNINRRSNEYQYLLPKIEENFEKTDIIVKMLEKQSNFLQIIAQKMDIKYNLDEVDLIGKKET